MTFADRLNPLKYFEFVIYSLPVLLGKTTATVVN